MTTQYYFQFNTYRTSPGSVPVGHANVTFYTITDGVRSDRETFGLNRPSILPTGSDPLTKNGVLDGVVQREDDYLLRPELFSQSVQVSESVYTQAQAYVETRRGPTDYALISKSCYAFAQEIWRLTGVGGTWSGMLFEWEDLGDTFVRASQNFYNADGTLGRYDDPFNMRHIPDDLYRSFQQYFQSPFKPMSWRDDASGNPLLLVEDPDGAIAPLMIVFDEVSGEVTAASWQAANGGIAEAWFASDGDAELIRVTNDDASRVETVFDADNAATWFSQEVSINSVGLIRRKT